MHNYPRWLPIEPLPGGAWPGELRTSRGYSQFKATAGQTLALLGDELERIKGTNPRLLIPAPREHFTVDMTRLRAGAEPWHPGVVLVFDSPKGEQRYPSDPYVRQLDNVRAIAKTLEALRAIDRWGVTAGQQYSGFLAIESGIAMSSGAPFRDAAGARHWLFEQLREAGLVLSSRDTDDDRLIRRALRITHPDAGGDAEQFRLVAVAQQFIESESRQA